MTDPSEIISFTKFVEWGFLVLLTGAIGYVTKSLKALNESVNEIKTSIKVAAAVYDLKFVFLEESLKDIQKRLERLETQKDREF